MGAKTSKASATTDVFEPELRGLNHIINNILNEDNLFKNKEYNFMSRDVCNKYQVVMESELSKHLKVQLAGLGESIYMVPKEREPLSTGIGKAMKNQTKAQICEMISGHYMRILYVLCLAKHVYNLAGNGDGSFGGRIIRNVHVVDNNMSVMYCKSKQRDGEERHKDFKINLRKLEGFKFFVDYILDDKESKAFMRIMRAILGRKPKAAVQAVVCMASQEGTMSPKELQVVHEAFAKVYGEHMVCGKHSTVGHIQTPEGDMSPGRKRGNHREVDTYVAVAENNPVLYQNFCTNIDKAIIDTTTKEGRDAKKLYEDIRKFMVANIATMQGIIERIVDKGSDGSYVLKNMDTKELDAIVQDTKSCVRTFFIRSVLDYQHLLDLVSKSTSMKVRV